MPSGICRRRNRNRTDRDGCSNCECGQGLFHHAISTSSLRRNPAPGKAKFRTLIRDGRDGSGSDGNRIGVRQVPD
jgi:hypothetical protein